jgi:DNA replicative helicase MCM subunit Mcm2 (Cdc46/Mcm family)
MPTAMMEERRWTAEQLSRASYKDLGSPAQVEERFLRHLLSLESCRSALEVLLAALSTTTRDYSLEIDAFDLLEADPVLGHLLLRFPSTLLPILENAIVSAQNELQQQQQQQQQTQQQLENVDGNQTPIMLVKGDKTKKGLPATRVHARLVHLPPTCCMTSVASMEAKDVGKIVQLSGTVVRTSPVQMYESARTYKCTGKNGCSRTFVQFADLEQRTNALVKPDRCPLTLESGQRCKGTNLPLEKDGSVHTDYQEIKIQEAGKNVRWFCTISFFTRYFLLRLTLYNIVLYDYLIQPQELALVTFLDHS